MAEAPRLDVAVIERMPEQPDIIADYDQLVSALRERIDKLAISQQLIDDLAGWAGGYAGKFSALARSRG